MKNCKACCYVRKYFQNKIIIKYNLWWSRLEKCVNGYKPDKNISKWVVTDLMEMHVHVFLFTVGAYWAEFVRFHPPQRHQQGEGTTGVIRAVPPPAPCWCCKWVFCFVWGKETAYMDTKTGTKWGINAVCVQLGLRYSRRPPLGHLSWAPEPGEPSSAGWSTVRWLGSMKTKACFPVLQKRKVSSDWPKSFFSIFTSS